MKKQIFFLIFIFILSSSCFAEDFNKAVARLAEELAYSTEWKNYPVALGLGNFFYADSKISSEFGYHFATEIEIAISNMSQFVLVNRLNLREILNEQGLQLTDLVDPNTAKKPGKIRGLDGLITGSYSIWEKKVRVKVELTRIEDTTMVVTSKLIDDIPKNVEVKPPNYDVQSNRITERVQDWFEETGAKKGEPRSDFHVTIEPEKSDVYKDGDELKLYVKSDRDCYIRIYYIQSDGTITEIFPNEYCKDNFIRANIRTPIPGNSDFLFRIFGPDFGVETLKIVASNKQFENSTRSLNSKGPYFEIGKIDQDETLESLKSRSRSVISTPSSKETSEFAQSYCTILTQPLTQ
jgi:hypothetical protein